MFGNACALLLGSALLISAVPVAQIERSLVRAAGQRPWSVRHADELRRLLIDRETVRRLLNEIDDPDPNAVGMIAEVAEYRIADLIGDGSLILVAAVDFTGRRFFNTLELVHRTPQGLVIRELHGFDLENLDRMLRDLDGDGTFEIVIPQLLRPYEGATKPQPTLPVVYAWNGQEYQKANARFPSFYREVVVPELERKLAEQDALRQHDLTASDQARRELRRAKYQAEIAAAKEQVPVTVIGAFANVWSDGEHERGYSVELWSVGREIIGTVAHHRGLIGDPPVGMLENVRFNAKTGALAFTAKLTDGFHTCPVHDNVPSHDVLSFRGVLGRTRLQGTFLIDDRTDAVAVRVARRENLLLRRDQEWSSQLMQSYESVRTWRQDQEPILKRRGPRW